MKKIKIVIMVLLMLILIVFMGVYVYSRPFNIHSSNEVEIEFTSSGNLISGTLYEPKGREKYPVVVFIHGDGAADRTANGSYSMLMNAFLDKGIGCYSYDKPGVGDSTGNWLELSMQERGVEVVNALEALRIQGFNEIGLIGLSQGGWVLSEVAQLTEGYDFMILMSGAIDWSKQGKYMQENRLKRSQMTKEEIETYNDYSELVEKAIIESDYDQYVSLVENSIYGEEVMSRDRFTFVHKNMNSNAIKGIKNIKSPFLGIFGEKDINVDAKESYETYRDIFKSINKQDYEVLMYEDGTHSLLKSRYESAFLTKSLELEMFFAGKNIYVDGVLDKLGDWVNEIVQ